MKQTQKQNQTLSVKEVILFNAPKISFKPGDNPRIYDLIVIDDRGVYWFSPVSVEIDATEFEIAQAKSRAESYFLINIAGV